LDYVLDDVYGVKLTDNAKNIPVAGSKMSTIKKDRICANEKIVALYPIELTAPPETAITPLNIGIKQSIKLPNALIT
jgi:hypothetical protein